MSQRNQHKATARSLRAALQERGIQLSHGECLDVVARASGLKNWNVLSAMLDKDQGAATDERCDFCGLSGRVFTGAFSGAICLSCAEGWVDGAHHRDLRERLDDAGEAFLSGKTTTELERYASVVARKLGEKERAIEQMSAFLAGLAPETVDLRPGMETVRWKWLATRTPAEVVGHRDGQLIELERSRAAGALVAEQLRTRRAT